MASVVYNGHTTGYYDCAGSAITSATQPDVKSGAIAGISTASLDSSKFVGVSPGDPLRMVSSVLVESTGQATGTYAGGNFAYQTAGKYVIPGYTTTLNNTAKRAMVSPGSERESQGISLHALTALRTRRVATAIRAGYWNEYSGTWSTAPATGNDFSTMGTDEAAAPTALKPGELSFMYGGYHPSAEDYSYKTSA